jgi:hypothetical protein
MKQLIPTDLIAIEVPEDSEYPILYPYGLMYLHSNGIEEKIELGDSIDDKHRLLGEVAKEGIRFDVEPYVFRSKTGTYRDYTYESKSFDNVGIFNALLQYKFKTPQESFQSLLQVNKVEIPENKKLLILLKQ